MADQQSYYLKGHLLGACSCDWGCPCSFEARPTQGFCEGNYAWHIAEGHYQGTPMTNPVTGADELATLYKPTGFTSKTHELCATRTYRVTLDRLAYDHSGKYGEFSPFEYAPA